jgi:hypothetical protein|tara:strand:+ start:4091 stop:4348 length:258 start_codon:yes stop_codon:yes gene_type:complete
MKDNIIVRFVKSIFGMSQKHSSSHTYYPKERIQATNSRKKTSLFFVTIAIIVLTLGAVRMTKDLNGYTKKKRGSKENITNEEVRD